MIFQQMRRFKIQKKNARERGLIFLKESNREVRSEQVQGEQKVDTNQHSYRYLPLSSSFLRVR